MASPIRAGESVYRGTGIPFKPSDSEIGKIVSILFSHPSSNASKGLLCRRNIKNVLHKTSPEFLRSFQNELQHVLIHAFNNRAQIPEELFILFIHQTLSLLPYAYPEKGFKIQIPVKKDENWELNTYRLDKKFELANQFLLSPMPALGFKSSSGGPPMLLFMGTTYPAGKGFLGTVLSDFTPFTSVGGLPFFCGRKELGRWLKENSGAHVMGTSLGGALSLHAAKHFSQYISKVFAYVPPGLYPRELHGLNNSKTEINLLFQDGDFVSTLGFFPEGKNVKLYQVYEEKSAYGVSAHSRVFLSSNNIEVFRDSAKTENRRISRKILTGLHMVFSPLIFLLVLPFYLVASLFKLLGKAILQTSSIFLSGSSQSRGIPPLEQPS